MGLKPCRECGAKVSTSAEICPHCGIRSPTAANVVLDPRDQRAAVAPKKPRGRGCLVATLLFLAFVGFVMYVDSNRTPEEKAADEREQQDVTACILAQDAVKDRLLAPSTADFPNCGSSLLLGRYDIRVNPDSTLFFVDGYVDAQNGFGAKIRSNFIVTLKHSGAMDDFSSFQVTNVVIE